MKGLGVPLHGVMRKHCLTLVVRIHICTETLVEIGGLVCRES